MSCVPHDLANPDRSRVLKFGGEEDAAEASNVQLRFVELEALVHLSAEIGVEDLPGQDIGAGTFLI